MSLKAILSSSKKAVQAGLKLAKVHSPSLFTGFGIVSLISAIPLTARGVRKFDKIMYDKQMDDLDEPIKFSELRPGEKIKIAGKSYWPVGVTVIAGVIFVVLGQVEQMRRLEAVEALLIAANGREEDLRKAIEDNLSAKKLQDVKGSEVEHAVERARESGRGEITVVENGVHFIDMFSGVLYQSTYEREKEAFAQFAFDMTDGDGRAPLSQLLYRRGLDAIDSTIGDIFEFNYETSGAALHPDFDKYPVREINGVMYVPVCYSYLPETRGYI